MSLSAFERESIVGEAREHLAPKEWVLYQRDSAYFFAVFVGLLVFMAVIVLTNGDISRNTERIADLCRAHYPECIVETKP